MIQIVRALLNNGGADPDLVTDKGKTPLYLAAKEGHKKIVILLARDGDADLEITSDQGWTAAKPATHNDNEEIAEWIEREIVRRKDAAKKAKAKAKANKAKAAGKKAGKAGKVARKPPGRARGEEER